MADWQRILGEGSELVSILTGHWHDLRRAYDRQPQEEILPALADEIIRSALHFLAREDVESNMGVLESLNVEPGCASCAFVQPGTSLVNLLVGRQPELREDVVTVMGVNIRVYRREGELTVVVGFLDHENIFERVFHDDLVERLRPLITRERIEQALRELLAERELARREAARVDLGLLMFSGLDEEQLAVLADEREERLRQEQIRHETSSGEGISLEEVLSLFALAGRSYRILD